LATYTNAVNNVYSGNASNYDKLILKALPKIPAFESNSLYERLSGVCFYISLLSDSKAILEYKKIQGIQI